METTMQIPKDIALNNATLVLVLSLTDLISASLQYNEPQGLTKKKEQKKN